MNNQWAISGMLMNYRDMAGKVKRNERAQFVLLLELQLLQLLLPFSLASTQLLCPRSIQKLRISYSILDDEPQKITFLLVLVSSSN